MAEYRCSICGEVHTGLLGLASRRPAHFWAVPEGECAARVACDDDLCVVDGREFLIRGVLELPIRGADECFAWGVWALVARRDFVRYVEAWRQQREAEVPPFAGRLSGGLLAYPDSDGLEVSIRVGGPGKRPLFRVPSRGPPLGVDQCEGIIMDRVHRFQHLVSR